MIMRNMRVLKIRLAKLTPSNPSVKGEQLEFILLRKFVASSTLRMVVHVPGDGVWSLFAFDCVLLSFDI